MSVETRRESSQLPFLSLSASRREVSLRYGPAAVATAGTALLATGGIGALVADKFIIPALPLGNTPSEEKVTARPTPEPTPTPTRFYPSEATPTTEEQNLTLPYRISKWKAVVTEVDARRLASMIGSDTVHVSIGYDITVRDNPRPYTLSFDQQRLVLKNGAVSPVLMGSGENELKQPVFAFSLLDIGQPYLEIRREQSDVSSQADIRLPLTPKTADQYSKYSDKDPHTPRVLTESPNYFLSDEYHQVETLNAYGAQIWRVCNPDDISMAFLADFPLVNGKRVILVPASLFSNEFQADYLENPGLIRLTHDGLIAITSADNPKQMYAADALEDLQTYYDSFLNQYSMNENNPQQGSTPPSYFSILNFASQYYDVEPSTAPVSSLSYPDPYGDARQVIHRFSLAFRHKYYQFRTAYDTLPEAAKTELDGFIVRVCNYFLALDDDASHLHTLFPRLREFSESRSMQFPTAEES